MKKTEEENEKQSEMEDKSDFKGRIDKVFGALFQSDGGWRLSDAEVQKKEWKREESATAREDTPCGVSFNGLMDTGRRTNKRSGGRKSDWEGNFGDSDDEDDDEREAGEGSSVANKGEEEEEEEELRDMRFVVGMDSTLDQEFPAFFREFGRPFGRKIIAFNEALMGEKIPFAVEENPVFRGRKPVSTR